MPRKAKATGSKKPALEAPKDEALETAAASSALDDHVIERPDGFYWESKSGTSHGPFTTLAEAEADMLSGGASAGADEADGEGLHEAESELGINEWIDPDTGGPAEDNVPRLEDH
jgi:hypothetical protein